MFLGVVVIHAFIILIYRSLKNKKNMNKKVLEM